MDRHSPQHPRRTFYAYTKEVLRFKRLAERQYYSATGGGYFPWAPRNFKWLYSLGGKQDHLIDLDRDLRRRGLPTAEALEAAGYFNQEGDDRLAVEAPTHKIGIVANNIPHFRKRQGTDTFGSLQRK